MKRILIFVIILMMRCQLSFARSKKISREGDLNPANYISTVHANVKAATITHKTAKDRLYSISKLGGGYYLDTIRLSGDVSNASVSNGLVGSDGSMGVDVFKVLYHESFNKNYLYVASKHDLTRIELNSISGKSKSVSNEIQHVDKVIIDIQIYDNYLVLLEKNESGAGGELTIYEIQRPGNLTKTISLVLDYVPHKMLVSPLEYGDIYVQGDRDVYAYTFSSNNTLMLTQANTTRLKKSENVIDFDVKYHVDELTINKQPSIRWRTVYALVKDMDPNTSNIRNYVDLYPSEKFKHSDEYRSYLMPGSNHMYVGQGEYDKELIFVSYPSMYALFMTGGIVTGAVTADGADSSDYTPPDDSVDGDVVKDSDKYSVTVDDTNPGNYVSLDGSITSVKQLNKNVIFILTNRFTLVVNLIQGHFYEFSHTPKPLKMVFGGEKSNYEAIIYDNKMELYTA